MAAGAFALAYRLFMRRDFTDLAYDGLGHRVLVRAVLWQFDGSVDLLAST